MAKFTDSENRSGNGQALSTPLNIGAKYNLFHLAIGKRPNFRKMVTGEHANNISINLSAELIEVLSYAKVHKVSKIVAENSEVAVPQISLDDAKELVVVYRKPFTSGITVATYGECVIPYLKDTDSFTIATVAYSLKDKVLGQLILTTLFGSGYTFVKMYTRKMKNIK